MTGNNQLSKQTTIKNEVSISGIGLHTGVKTTATFNPAPENFGIRFKRLDLENCPEIVADIDHVLDISRGTQLARMIFAFIQLNIFYQLFSDCRLIIS